MGNFVNILITDDREGIRNLLREVLEVAGYTAHAASSGHEALKKVKEETIELVFLDMNMPGMDGLETLRLLKKVRPDTIVIMMTAYEDSTVLNDALHLGASCFLTKPFDLEDFKIVAERELNHARAASM